MFPIETYVARRRGTLRKYLEENRAKMLEEAMAMTAPSKNVNKILWWKQEWISKEKMTEMTNFWFS